MLFEALFAYTVQKKKKENFVEDESVDKNEWTIFDIAYVIISVVWLLIAIALYIRIIVSAFYCGIGQGASALLFPSHYGLYKFGDLINVSCQRVLPSL